MDSSLVLAVLMVFSAVGAIAMLVFEVKRFLHGEGRYGTRNPESE